MRQKNRTFCGSFAFLFMADREATVRYRFISVCGMWYQNTALNHLGKAVEYFESKHGYKPAFDKPVPDLSFDDVSSILKTITKNND